MIRIHHAHLDVTALTHPGMSGKQNEDRFAVSAYRLGPGNLTPSVLAVVSDGIGGHRAGEVAAEMAVETISRTVAGSNGRQPLNILKQAIQLASQAIAAQARDDTQRLGMGTTCACVWVIADRLFTASVGDSRIYLLRGKSFHQLTTDHTWVREAVERGLLEPAQARDHPNVHVIRRYLGSSQPPQPDLRLRLHEGETDSQAESNQGLQIFPGDKILLCSDGLTDLVVDDEIQATITGRGMKEAVQALVDLACERGGHDNITVVLMAVPKNFRIRRRNQRLRLWLTGALMGVILLTVVLAALAWSVLQPILWPTGPTVTSTPTPVTVTPTFTPTATLTATPSPTATEAGPWATSTSALPPDETPGGTP